MDKAILLLMCLASGAKHDISGTIKSQAYERLEPFGVEGPGTFSWWLVLVFLIHLSLFHFGNFVRYEINIYLFLFIRQDHILLDRRVCFSFSCPFISLDDF